jgi:hypothetical protein
MIVTKHAHKQFTKNAPSPVSEEGTRTVLVPSGKYQYDHAMELEQHGWDREASLNLEHNLIKRILAPAD